MQFDQHKPKTQRPTNGSGNTTLELKDLKAEVPQVDDLLGEIDRLLRETARRKQCGC
jgi:hypothetical protein